MENLKPAKTEKKGFNWDGLLGFTSEIAKLAIVAGLSAYVSETVRNAVNKRKESGSIVDFPIRKVA